MYRSGINIFSPDGRKIATSFLSQLQIMEADTGQNLLTIAHLKTIFKYQFSPDGGQIRISRLDGYFQINDLNTGQIIIKNIFNFSERIRSTRFSLDGNKLLISYDNGSIDIVDVKTGMTMHSIPLDYNNSMVEQNISPDGSKLITADYDGYANITDLNTGAIIHTLGERVNHNITFAPTTAKLSPSLIIEKTV